MKQQQILLAVIVVGFALASALFIHQRRPAQPLGEVVMQGVADVVAEELATRLGLSGKLVLIQGAESDQISDAVKQLPQQLIAALEKRGVSQAIETVKIRTVGSDLSDLPQGAAVPLQVKLPYAQVPYDEFSRALAGHPDAVAVLSLVGPPRVTASDAGRWSSASAKFIVVMPVGDPLVVQDSLARGITALAVVPRQHGLTRPSTSERTRAWFDSQYQVLTPDTVAELK